jgi:hypothetical protein
MPPIVAADFRTRVYLQFLQVVHEAGMDPNAFVLKVTAVDPPLEPDHIDAMITIHWSPGGLSRTYWSSPRRSWVGAFSNDIRTGRFG